MTTNKWIVDILNVAGAVTGMLAARYWYKSCKVPIQPSWSTEPGDSQDSQMGWMAGMMNASTEVAKLNKTAALLTAVSVALTVASTLVGILG